jgi:hypothetical protein
MKVSAGDLNPGRMPGRLPNILLVGKGAGSGVLVLVDGWNTRLPGPRAAVLGVLPTAPSSGAGSG